MSLKHRAVSVCLLSIVTILTAVAVAAAARSVEPVTNLHLVSGTANQVKIAWDVGPQPNLGGATIDRFIIRRDGRRIATLEGFNGLVETSYIDGDPSSSRAVYSVVAVDSTGLRSPPRTVSVAAPQAAPQQNQPANKSADDGIQSSNLCRSIIPPNVRGGNQPTALEKYGCGKGMNAVNDSEPDEIGVGPLKTDKPRPIHDFLQNFFIQLPITLGQTFFLLISAFATWVTLPSTYLGISQLFAGVIQAFNGNPNRPGLIALALAIGIATLSILVIRDQYRKGYITAGMFALVMAILALFLANPFNTMETAVDKPLSLYTAVANETTNMIDGSVVEGQFNLTVQPTFHGNKSYNAIRKAENNDWLMFQYLPQCAMNFGDFRWAIEHKYPDSRMTWCEKFVQVWGEGDDDAKKKFKEELKDANEGVFNFFDGGDQGQRILMSIVSKLTLLEHNLLKFGMKASLYIGMMLLLAELLFAVIWLIALLVGTQSSRLSAERRMRTMWHWLKVPLVLLLIMLVQQAVEAKIINDAMDDGFLWMSAKAFIFDLIVICGSVWWLKKERQEHKAAMDRLGAYRNESSGIMSTVGRYAGAALAGGAAGVAAEKVRDNLSGDDDEKGESNASESTFDFSGFSSDQPLLESRTGGDSSGNGGRGPDGPPSSDGGGGRHFDFEDPDAEEIDPNQRELVMATGSGPDDLEADVSVDEVRVDGDFTLEPEIVVDADVVVDGDSADADFSVSDDSSLDDGDFRTEGDDRF